MNKDIDLVSGSDSEDIFAQINTPVVYVIPSLSTGGAELQTINHVNYLHKKTVSVKLVVLSKHIRNLTRIKIPESQVKIHYKNSYETLGKGYLLNLFGIVRFLMHQIPRGKKMHVILVLEESHVAGRLLKIFRPKVIIHCYFRDVHYSPNHSLGVKVFDWLNDILARRMDDSSFFISDAVKKDIEGKFFTKNLLTVPNSLPDLDIDDSAGKVFLEQSKLNRPFLILFPGRLHEKKGHLPFLTEFYQFMEKEGLDSKDVGLLMVGEGPERGSIEKKIQEMNLSNSAFLAGELPYETLLSLYKCSDLVVIPSLREGFGNVAIEGLMQRSLMLVSNVDGLKEIIRDKYNGFKFDVNKKGDCAQKLSFLYQNRNNQLIDPDELQKDFQLRYSLYSQMTRIIQHLKDTELRRKN